MYILNGFSKNTGKVIAVAVKSICIDNGEVCVDWAFMSGKTEYMTIAIENFRDVHFDTIDGFIKRYNNGTEMSFDMKPMEDTNNFYLDVYSGCDYVTGMIGSNIQCINEILDFVVCTATH